MWSLAEKCWACIYFTLLTVIKATSAGCEKLWKNSPFCVVDCWAQSMWRWQNSFCSSKLRMVISFAHCWIKWILATSAAIFLQIGRRGLRLWNFPNPSERMEKCLCPFTKKKRELFSPHIHIGDFYRVIFRKKWGKSKTESAVYCPFFKKNCVWGEKCLIFCKKWHLW